MGSSARFQFRLLPALAVIALIAAAFAGFLQERRHQRWLVRKAAMDVSIKQREAAIEQQRALLESEFRLKELELEAEMELKKYRQRLEEMQELGRELPGGGRLVPL